MLLRQTEPGANGCAGRSNSTERSALHFALGANQKADSASKRAGGRRQYRELSGGTNFGLAQIESVDALEIRWPSGLRQRFEQLPINTSIRITEGADRWEFVYRRDSGGRPEEPEVSLVSV